MSSDIMPKPRVSIVIVNYETSAMVRRCLESLARQDVPLEVTIVDNPSPARDLDKLAGLDGSVLPGGSPVRIILMEENVGYGRACNAGLAAATAPYVCILNPDIVIPPGELARWIEAFESEHSATAPPLGLLAPRLLNENGREQRSSYPFPGFWSHWIGQSIFAGALKALRKRAPRSSTPGSEHPLRPNPPSAPLRTVNWVMGAALLLSRDVWQKIEGFSPEYFLYAEDTDLCWKVWQAGYRVAVASEVALIHTQGNPAPEKRAESQIRLFTGLRTFITTRYGPLKRTGVRLAVILDMLIRLALFTPLALLRQGHTLARARVKGSLAVLRMYLRPGSPE